MERYINDLTLLATQIERLEEQKSQQRYFYHLLAYDRFPLEDSFDEIINYLVCSPEATFLLHHFSDFHHVLSHKQQQAFAKLQKYYIRQQIASKCFHQSFSKASCQLTDYWLNGYRGESILELLPNLNPLRDYFTLLYQSSLQVPHLTYYDVLIAIYGRELTDFYYPLIQECKDSFLRLYQNHLESFPLHLSPTCYLNFSKEQSILALNAIISISKPFLHHEAIHLRFGSTPIATVHRYQGRIDFNLGVFTDFFNALHQCLKLLGDCFLSEYKETISLEETTSYQVLQMEQTILEFCKLLPLLSSRITEAIVIALYPEKKDNNSFKKHIQEELVYQYFRIDKCDNSLESYQPIQEVLRRMIEMEIEENWFNGKLDSIEIPYQWAQLSEKYLLRKPHSHLEGILRHIYWTNGEIGVAFGKLIGLFSIFCEGIPRDPYPHLFADFLYAFEHQNLTPWKPSYNLVNHLHNNKDASHYCWVFLQTKLRGQW